MIGWKEATADLLFLEPVLNSIGVELDKEDLKRAYLSEVRDFFVKNEFVNSNLEIQGDKIATEIMKGKDFYPALSDTNTAKTPEEAKQVASQVNNLVELHHDFDGKLETF
jgi:hypothetical protein